MSKPEIKPATEPIPFAVAHARYEAMEAQTNRDRALIADLLAALTEARLHIHVNGLHDEFLNRSGALLARAIKAAEPKEE